ncbi:hypothetical protein P8C59_004426 [Phyllachora maydis]|uniref:DUF7053 domain-containing protein n=1 Tax=Phyllachora maydis TaxID=1825666 RepID=A0AAD9I3N2_9PEZI|nr:hypothetical protein P8C59_004426 [Phyllachora maydis]
MGFLDTEETTEHISDIDGAVTPDAAIAALHEHELFLRTDPFYLAHAALATGRHEVRLPDAIQAKLAHPAGAAGAPPTTVFFDHVDRVPGYAAKFMPGVSTTTTHYQFTDTTDGVYIHGFCGMNVLVVRTYEIVVGGQGSSGLRLVERVRVRCSKLLRGVVRSSIADNWHFFHEAFVAKMGGEVAAPAS